MYVLCCLYFSGLWTLKAAWFSVGKTPEGVNKMLYSLFITQQTNTRKQAQLAWVKKCGTHSLHLSEEMSALTHCVYSEYCLAQCRHAMPVFQNKWLFSWDKWLASLYCSAQRLHSHQMWLCLASASWLLQWLMLTGDHTLDFQAVVQMGKTHVCANEGLPTFCTL